MATTFTQSDTAEVLRGADDGHESWALPGSAPGTWDGAASDVIAGVSGGTTEYMAAMRFPSFVPDVATVVSATLLMQSNTVNGSPDIGVHFVLLDDVPPLGGLLLSALPRTIAFTVWQPTTPGVEIVDVTAAYAELLATVHRESGRYVAAVMVNNGGQSGTHEVRVDAYEAAVGASQLVVNYSVPLVTIARIPAVGLGWARRVTTPRLPDLTRWRYKVSAVDAAGNVSDAVEDGPIGGVDGRIDRVVRTPDAPNFTLTYDDGTQTVEFASV